MPARDSKGRFVKGSGAKPKSPKVKGGWSWSDFGEGFVEGFTKTLPIAMTLTGLGVKGKKKRGGSSSASSSSEGPSHVVRTLAQAVSSILARVNSLRRQLNMEPIVLPEFHFESEHTHRDRETALRNYQASLLDQERLLQHRMRQQESRNAMAERHGSEGRRRGMSGRNLFE